MQCEHADIKAAIMQEHVVSRRGQELQLEVTERGHADIQCRQEHQLEVTERGLEKLQEQVTKAKGNLLL